MILTFAIVVVLAVALAFCRRGSTPAIDRREHPNGVASLQQVTVNDTRQWVLIRSEDVANPVVLFVHGGPGTSQLALMRHDTRALEKHYTVVNWDQRLAGKSFAAGADRSRLHVDQYVADVIAVASDLTTRFGKERIVLVGHSWGSAIGLMAVARRPDLFWAYVGIGQVSRMLESERLSYAWTLAQARAAGDARSVRNLTAMGPPPYTGRAARRNFVAQRSVLARYGGEFHGSTTGAFGVVLRHMLLGREYTLADRINFFRGVFRSMDALLPQLYALDLFTQVPAVQVPATFCLGRHDQEVPSALSARYFEALRAPAKRLVWFEDSAHMPNTEERDRFNAFMVDTVRASLPPGA